MVGMEGVGIANGEESCVRLICGGQRGSIFAALCVLHGLYYIP